MSLGIRGKLFVLTVVVIALLDALLLNYLEGALTASMEERAHAELLGHAKSVGALLEVAGPDPDFDEIADRVAGATGVPISLHDVAGRSLGDSQLTPVEIEQLTTPTRDGEMVAATTAGTGAAKRPDPVTAVPVLFVATKIAAPAGALIARASVPLTGLDAMVSKLRVALVACGVMGVGIAGMLLLVVGSQVERALQPVVSSAAAAVQTQENEVVIPEADGSPSLNTVAADLERTMTMLTAERNRFSAVLQTMEQAVLVLGPDERLATVNRAAHTMLAVPERSVGRTLLEAVRVPKLKRIVSLAGEGGAHKDEFDLPGGRRVRVRATQQGDEGVVLVAEDVTEIRRLERVRRDFVANVSHELRTPISVVKANAETLLDGGLEEPKVARMFVEAIHRHADRLGRIVNDLLDISRIEAGRYPLSPAPMELGDLIDHVLDLIEVDAQQKNIEVTVTVEPKLGIVADRKALEHVLINLTSNAFKYTPEGGQVEVTGRILEDGRVRVEVLDDGPGIDPAHRERIFERFFRADSGRSRDMGGTGLGLSIVKHLIDAHEGEVGVDPRSPKGSIFWFTLPDSETPAEVAQLR